jgi:hypothetical protein
MRDSLWAGYAPVCTTDGTKTEAGRKVAGYQAKSKDVVTKYEANDDTTYTVTATADGIIYYRYGGTASEGFSKAYVYTKPIILSKGTYVTFVNYEDGCEPSDVKTVGRRLLSAQAGKVTAGTAVLRITSSGSDDVLYDILVSEDASFKKDVKSFSIGEKTCFIHNLASGQDYYIKVRCDGGKWSQACKVAM